MERRKLQDRRRRGEVETVVRQLILKVGSHEKGSEARLTAVSEPIGLRGLACRFLAYPYIS